jgi:hypothetical protein
MSDVEFSITGFGFAQHSLTASQKRTIRSIAERLLSGGDEVPRLSEAKMVEIIGHAIGTHNLEMHANKRAESVLNQLKEDLTQLGASNAGIAKVKRGEPVTKHSSGTVRVGDRKVLIAVHRRAARRPNSPTKNVAKRVDAILIVPNQGHAHRSFLAVARKLKRELYSGRAEIVKATVPSSSVIGVTLETDGGGAFSWSDYSGLKTVMVISHAGPCDGPNLDHDASGVQPWRVKEGTQCTDDAELIPAGVKFWRKVGDVLRKNGKVVLMSCHCGENNYSPLVAEAAEHTVFAADGDFAAAHGAAALNHARKMEAGRPTNIFKKFTPPK